MWRKIIQNWREILGWLVIAFVAYIYYEYLFGVWHDYSTYYVFRHLVELGILTAFILTWLRLNK